MSQESINTVFESAANNNLWGDPDSKSGTGSNLFQTRIIRETIPELISKYSIKQMLDAPCGDFFWMKEIVGKINAFGCDYTGADIVKSIVDENTAKFGNEMVKFIQLNLIEGPIPKVDLIFTRDCFLHLSFDKIYKILNNYKMSGSKYLLVSTYSNKERVNVDVEDISIPGRTLNMHKYPFKFPKPLLVINEGCTEGNGAYSDKSLLLVKLKDIDLSAINVGLKFIVIYNISIFISKNLLKVKNKLRRILKLARQQLSQHS